MDIIGEFHQSPGGGDSSLSRMALEKKLRFSYEGHKSPTPPDDPCHYEPLCFSDHPSIQIFTTDPRWVGKDNDSQSGFVETGRGWMAPIWEECVSQVLKNPPVYYFEPASIFLNPKD